MERRPPENIDWGGQEIAVNQIVQGRVLRMNRPRRRRTACRPGGRCRGTRPAARRCRASSTSPTGRSSATCRRPTPVVRPRPSAAEVGQDRVEAAARWPGPCIRCRDRAVVLPQLLDERLHLVQLAVAVEADDVGLRRAAAGRSAASSLPAGATIQTPAVSGCDGSASRPRRRPSSAAPAAISALFGSSVREPLPVGVRVGVVGLVEKVPGVDPPVVAEMADHARGRRP